MDCLPPPLYDQYPIPIKNAKADNVRALVTKYVPIAHQIFYSERLIQTVMSIPNKYQISLSSNHVHHIFITGPTLSVALLLVYYSH